MNKIIVIVFFSLSPIASNAVPMVDSISKGKNYIFLQSGGLSPIIFQGNEGDHKNYDKNNLISTSFLWKKKNISDSLKQRRHGIYIEPWLFGRMVTFGYSYEFLKRNRFTMSASVGAGGTLRFRNPTTAFFIPFGINSKFQLKKHFHITGGIYNFYYINYWAHFSNEGKNCFGIGKCPPDTDPFILMPFIGGSLEYDRISFELKTYFSFFAWWSNKVYPLPALRIKLKL